MISDSLKMTCNFSFYVALAPHLQSVHRSALFCTKLQVDQAQKLEFSVLSLKSCRDDVIKMTLSILFNLERNF